MDKDDESELRNMIFHADVKQADRWSHGHARTVEQHPAIPRSVCGDRTGALSTANLIALSPFSSSSANCAAGAAANEYTLIRWMHRRNIDGLQLRMTLADVY